MKVPKGSRWKTFKSLFRYFDTTDWFVFTIGAFFAIAQGASMPLFALFFGDATTSVGLGGSTFMAMMVEVVWKMGIIAGIVLVAGTMHTMCKIKW